MDHLVQNGGDDRLDRFALYKGERILFIHYFLFIDFKPLFQFTHFKGNSSFSYLLIFLKFPFCLNV